MTQTIKLKDEKKMKVIIILGMLSLVTEAESQATEPKGGFMRKAGKRR